MAYPFTEKQLRDAIAARIETASGSQRVYSFNCLDYKFKPDGSPDIAHWPGQFTYADGGEEIIHGWVIRRTARVAELRAGCEEMTATYDVHGFFGFSHTGLTSNYSNSDDEFGAIVDAVVAEFNEGAGNGLITVEGVAVQHFGLQMPVLTVMRAGSQLLHFAGGMIETTFLS